MVRSIVGVARVLWMTLSSPTTRVGSKKRRFSIRRGCRAIVVTVLTLRVEAPSVRTVRGPSRLLSR